MPKGDSIMKLKNRKLYSHGQANVFLVQIPKIFSDDLGFNKDTMVDIELEGNKIVITPSDLIEKDQGVDE